ncbi:MAG TPA: hypothetical protein VFW27_30100 [Actinoplanes sp.]|jgi:hypothetical protein|nr:hypothetical protein [Actinoplanes sp.]
MPIPDLAQPRFVRPAHYSVTVIDGHGRVSAMASLRTLGWKPRALITFEVDARHLVSVTRCKEPAQIGGTAPCRQITARGHLNLPLTIRRRADIGPGDRLLIAADTVTNLLWIFPPKTLALILQPHTAGRNAQP